MNRRLKTTITEETGEREWRAPKRYLEERGVKEIMDARHTIMGFSGAVEKEIHRFV